MSKLLLCKPGRENSCISGNSNLELVSKIPGVVLDAGLRRAVISGIPDTVSFSDEYSAEELPAAMAKRVLQKYINDYGWKLYREVV